MFVVLLEQHPCIKCLFKRQNGVVLDSRANSNKHCVFYHQLCGLHQILFNLSLMLLNRCM